MAAPNRTWTTNRLRQKGWPRMGGLRFESSRPATANPSRPCPPAPAQLHTRPNRRGGGDGGSGSPPNDMDHHLTTTTERRERCSTTHTSASALRFGVHSPSGAVRAGSTKPEVPSSPDTTERAAPSPCDDQMPIAPSAERTEGSKPCSYGRPSPLRVWVQFPRAARSDPRSECPPTWRPFARS